MVSRIALIPYVKGSHGSILRKNLGISSMGYVPEEPGICTITKSTPIALPICLNVVDNA